MTSLYRVDLPSSDIKVMVMMIMIAMLMIDMHIIYDKFPSRPILGHQEDSTLLRHHYDGGDSFDDRYGISNQCSDTKETSLCSDITVMMMIMLMIDMANPPPTPY